jgi:hypothetical protein
MLKHFILLVVLMLLSGVAQEAAALNEKPIKEDVVEVEYLKPVAIDLKANPGQTVSRSISVPTQITLPDGTTRLSQETITFTLINSVQSTNADMQLGRNILATTTYLRCSGVLNASSRAYTSFVDWHYNGTYAWHDDNGHLNHSASSPWQTNGYNNHLDYAYGPLTSIPTYTVGYFKNPSAGSSVDDASHQVIWILEKTGECKSTGYIALY